MRLSEILNEDARWVWSVTLKDKWRDESYDDPWTENDNDGIPDIMRWEYDVRLNGKVVGSIDYDDFFGHMRGDFGARTVEISKYADPAMYPMSEDDEEGMEAYILSGVSNYFDSKIGKMHFEVMSRQQGLEPQSIEKEELEEIKVTKTLAKKRTTPMKDMATKEKMTRKKKGKDGKIKKDAKKPMNRNVHDLANITLKGEYRS